jgi:uncharacterized membrane protein YozB (DUF420 family)
VSITDLPLVNTTLNAISAMLLVWGRMNIKRLNQNAHKKIMIAAIMCSALFLTFYLIYHYYVGSVPYPHHDWTRPIYFAILIPHVILAAVMVPFIIAALWFALGQKFDRHKRLVRFVWPVWMFVSLSGIMVYLMLYQL